MSLYSRRILSIIRNSRHSAMMSFARAAAGGFHEEDSSPYYRGDLFYPACVGQTINRFKIISKLGWGTHSTVWLAKEVRKWPWQSDRYVALKITNALPDSNKAAMEELEISHRIATAASGTEAKLYIRLVQDHFTIDGPSGQHLVLAFEPLREPIWMLGRRLGQQGLPLPVLKTFLKIMVKSLAFIHKLGIVHTDLKLDNFLLVFEDKAVIHDYVRQQESNMAPTKTVQGRVIYQSQGDFGPLRKAMGLVKLSDFGSAVVGDSSTRLFYHDIQPQGLEAPEVLFKTGWNCSADIWNLGTMLWELLQEEPLLLGRDVQTGVYSREAHVAQLQRLLGPPPKALLERAGEGILQDLYNSDGVFKRPDLIPPPSFTLSSLTSNIADEEEKRLFLEFAGKMLKWLPEERATAEELFHDPWFSI